jgi:hypothetical protein
VWRVKSARRQVLSPLRRRTRPTDRLPDMRFIQSRIGAVLQQVWIRHVNGGGQPTRSEGSPLPRRGFLDRRGFGEFRISGAAYGKRDWLATRDSVPRGPGARGTGWIMPGLPPRKPGRGPLLSPMFNGALRWRDRRRSRRPQCRSARCRPRGASATGADGSRDSP